MKKMIGFSVMAAVLVSSVSAFAGISQREAQIAKERLARCQYNDAVCAGNVIIDALSNDRPEQFPGGNNGANNGGAVGEQRLVMYYAGSDNCSAGLVSTTTVLSSTNVQSNINECSRITNSSRVWSIKLNGTCIDIPDTDVKGACMEAVNRLTTGR